MTNLDIKISIKSLSTITKQLKCNLDDDTLLLLIRAFTYYVRDLYMAALYEEIQSPRYKGAWEPSNEPGYLEFLGVTPDPLLDIYHMIIDALEVVKIGRNFIIRINPSYKYPKSSLTLVRVLRAIENGTTKFPARPIFRQTVSRIQSNLVDLWEGFLAWRGVI